MTGSRIKYSEHELTWVKRHAHLARREIAERFAKQFGRSDVSESNIKGLCTRKGWSAGPAGKSRNTGKSLLFTVEQTEWIKANAALSRAETHTQFCTAFPATNITQAQLTAYRKRAGIKSGRTGHFVKGQEPVNKGKKMPYHPNSARTQFKSGQRPHTYRGPGHEMTCPKDGYVYLIVAEKNPHTGSATRRVLKHKWLWEQANGPIPDGQCLKSIDGDRTNTDPGNWMAIPRGLLPRLSGRWTNLNYDKVEPELRPYILAAAKLRHAAKTAHERTGSPNKGGPRDG